TFAHCTHQATLVLDRLHVALHASHDSLVVPPTSNVFAYCPRDARLIKTFMRARDRRLVEFVKKVSAICRGKAYFTNTMTLGQFILMDFMRRKTRRVS